MEILKEATAVDVLIGPFVDATDGVTPEAGLTLAQANITLSKNGQALAQKTDATTAVADGSNGYYNCELDATDTGTIGTLVLTVYDSEALPVRHEYMVMQAEAYDLLYGTGTGPRFVGSARHPRRQDRLGAPRPRHHHGRHRGQPAGRNSGEHRRHRGGHHDDHPGAHSCTRCGGRQG